MHIHRIVIALLFSVAALTLHAQKQWVGSISSDWNTAGNWSPSGVPGSGSNVVIGPISGGNYSPTITNLEMGQWNKPSTLIIKENAVLTVTGSLTIVSSATIRLQSGGTLNHTGTSATSFPGYGTGYLAIENGHFITNGNFTINTSLNIDSGSMTVNGNLYVHGGSSFTNKLGKIVINGNLTLNNQNSSFHAGNDSLIVNGVLSTLGNPFYGDTAKIVVNGNGTNQIEGNFYTNAATIYWNPTSLTQIKSGGRYYVNTGTVYFNDSCRVGNNGKLYTNSGTIVFSKSMLVSSDGELDAGTGNMTFQGNATFSNSGTMNAGSANVSFGGDVTINNSGGTINADSSNITISGNISNSGNFNSGSSTVTLNGDTDQVISDDIVFFNLNIETQGTLSAGGNVTVLNDGNIGSNSEISIPDNNDQFEVNGDLIDSSGTLAVNTNKPFVTGINVMDSVTIRVLFNEQVTQSSAENAANSTWSGHTISSRTLVDTNVLQLVFTPYIVRDVEYTLVFQNIENLRVPVGTMNAGHEKRFTWASPTAPTVSPSNLTFTSVSSGSMTLNWTNGNGARRIVIAREASAVNYTPSNGTSYSGNASFGSGTPYNTDNYVVYDGTGNSVAVTGLSSGTTYHFTVYEYNGTGSYIVYRLSSPLSGNQATGVDAPSNQVTGLHVSGSSDTSITLSWTRGNGSGCILIARESAPITGLPVNGIDYAANAIFGDGAVLIPGSYVVYNGTGTSVTISGLETNRSYYFTAFERNGFGLLSNYLLSTPATLSTNTHVLLDLTLFLEGPFDGTHMNPALNQYLPDTQVYKGAPWNYNGGEAVDTIPNDSIVDWVLVELRQASLPNQATDTSIVGRRAGFLLANGKIVDLDGVSPLRIPTNRAGRMFVVVYHRTHIPIESSDSLIRSGNRFIYDFSTSGSMAFGNSPLKDIGGGKYGMYCGRVATNTGQAIGISDAVAAWDDRNRVGYYAADVNLDGLVDAADRSQIWNNQGISAELAE